MMLWNGCAAGSIEPSSPTHAADEGESAGQLGLFPV